MNPVPSSGRLALATRVVHQESGPEGREAAVVPAIGMSTVYAHGNQLNFSYGRDHNSNWQRLEAALADLEGGQEAVLFGSGMAAIAATIDAHGTGGKVAVAADAYSGTRRLLEKLHRQGRLQLELFDVTDQSATVEACKGSRLVMIETLGNPLLTVPDIGATAEMAHRQGALLAVDNTFATPLLTQPLELGADLVLHSATKFIGGHSDLIMGVAVGSQELVAPLRDHRTDSGAIPGQLEAWLAIRGLKTLQVRLRRQCQTALFLAERLSQLSGVTRVHYPGLPGHPQHQLARSQMTGGFGAVVSIELDCDGEQAEAICSATRIWTNATSLGAVESLLERRRRWPGEEHLPASLIRLSVGVEDQEDLLEDLRSTIAAGLSSP